MYRPLSIAIIQRTAIYLNLPGSLDLAESMITECADKGAQLIVFGECWLTGYPAWLDHVPDYARWNDPGTKEVFKEMHQNSVVIPGPAIERLQTMCKLNNVCICMGCNEVETPSTGTIYNSFVIIDNDGQLILHHRKLMPTYTEKLLYGQGDGRGMCAVDTSAGRIGALICWEHWMPLLRQAMHDSVEEIHIALWPQVHDMLQIASRHYAFEGRCFVIAVGQLMEASQIPDSLSLPEGRISKAELLLNGGSSVIGPDGLYLLEPQFGGPDIIYYRIDDLDAVYSEKMTLDVSGHYQRPDLFEFRVK